MPRVAVSGGWTQSIVRFNVWFGYMSNTIDDETWIRNYTPETKQQSKHWVSMEAKTLKLVGNVMTTEWSTQSIEK